MEDIISGTYFADDTGQIMIVKLQGYIDQTNSFSLQKVFDDIIKSGCFNVIIDFSEVMYISSAGWGIFVGEIKHFRDEGGDIKLANMTPDIYEVYQMLEFYHIFEDFNTIESAKNSFVDLAIKDNMQTSMEEVQNDTLEINIDEDEENYQGENILDISSLNGNEAINNESQEELFTGDKKYSEDIDITIDENIDSEVESIDINSVHSEEKTNRKDPVSENASIIDLSKLPLHEKIKKLIAEYPLLSIWKIKKLLKDERFGTIKINIFKLYRILKELQI